MAEEFVAEQDEKSEPDFAELPQDHPLVRAYQAEREKRKAAEARAKAAAEEADTYLRVKARFPWLEKDLLKGSPSEWEPWAERLDQLRGSSAQQTETSSVPQEPVTRPEEATFAKAAQVPAGTAGSTDSKVYSPSEIQEIGQRNPAEALAILARQKQAL